MAKPFRQAKARLYNSKSWKKVREYIFNRDLGLCQVCGNPGEEVHHIEPLSPKNLEDPVVAFGEDNLTLLCRDCHFKVHRELDEMFKRKERQTPIAEGLMFDIEGNLVQHSPPIDET